MIEVLLFGFISNWGVDKLAAKYQWTDRNIIIGALGVFFFVSLYGCTVRFFDRNLYSRMPLVPRMLASQTCSLEALACA
jgi:hypothetical protein